jgi:hypothetical protein
MIKLLHNLTRQRLVRLSFQVGKFIWIRIDPIEYGTFYVVCHVRVVLFLERSTDCTF